ncbi:hypothetical protein AAHA92_02654 [Salvia divinorum]|uniref:Uncharacterized protein n=1 Tax=Salvia divinorum TaxID=28513 RepID=A0ABD1IFF5_SALDI
MPSSAAVAAARGSGVASSLAVLPLRQPLRRAPVAQSHTSNRNPYGINLEKYGLTGRAWQEEDYLELVLNIGRRIN